jgi:hypothetical protein
LLFAYRLLGAAAIVLPARLRDALKARCALAFSALSDGGLDDDFAEQVFQIVRMRPGLLPDLAGKVRGEGLAAMRQRGTLQMVETLLRDQRTSIFG